MRTTKPLPVAARLIVVILSAGSVLAACGGGDDNAPSLGGGFVLVSIPGVPQNLTANVGTNALSLGWDASANTGGSSALTYEVEVTASPVQVVPPSVTVTTTRALITNVSLGRTYTVVVRARNSAGVSAPTPSLVLSPQSVINTAYVPLAIAGDPAPLPNPNSGTFDPSVLRLTNGQIWMSYSSVSYYNNGSAQLVQDVGIRLARSTNGGATFNYVSTIATPSNTTVTDASLTACGALSCSGRWVYETSWLIDDSSDPNPARRYKLFAHKYFLHPGSTPATFYQLGSIVMWTASAPDGTWSAETSLLGWNLTPPELTPLRVLNSVNPTLASCIVFAEGSASVRGSTIDFVFACPELVGNQFPQKIVLVRTSDHANTFQYVSTLLTAADAAPLTASHYSAPALLATPGAAPILIVTAVSSNTGAYGGCTVFPIANDVTGELFRANGFPVSILTAPAGGIAGGACTYDRSLGSRGMLVTGVILPIGSPAVNAQFTIQATQAVLQQP